MVINMRRSVEGLLLPPGFRFYPTDEELVWHYLRKKADAEPFQIPIIAEVDLYKFNPWDLPEMALFGEKEWFFFSPRDRKYPNGKRPNRAAASGYWKATGTDKPIFVARDGPGGDGKVGVKKSLVFYCGRAPRGEKTNWIMHEYRLADGVAPIHRHRSLRLDDWVLCRIYEKPSPAQRDRDIDPLPAHEESLMEGMVTEDGTLSTPQRFQTTAWELPLVMASTSHDPAPFRHRAYADPAAAPARRSPASDEESQSAFQSYGFDAMYPTLGYDHQSTASYATPGFPSISSTLPFDFSYSFPHNNN